MATPGRALIASLIVLAVAGCQVRPALGFSPAMLPDGVVGQAYQATITVTDNETPVGDIYAVGELPAGLTLTFDRDAEAAQLSGTPAAAGNFALVIAAWCLGTSVSGQTGRHEYTLVVR